MQQFFLIRKSVSSLLVLLPTLIFSVVDMYFAIAREILCALSDIIQEAEKEQVSSFGLLTKTSLDI